MTANVLYKTRPPLIFVWWLAIRPKTLSLSWVPIVVGSSLAWREQGYISWLTSGVAMLTALLIQIGTNLHNDAKDFEHGIDREDRQGPVRVTAMGWLSAAQVRKGAYVAFILGSAMGLYLVWVGGMPILIMGVLSVAAGLAYTGGPRPIAYSSTGELYVFLFFGLIAVVGTYFLNVGHITQSALQAGCAMGSLAAAVLVVNNYRDIVTDKAVGKATLAVIIGSQATRLEYTLLVLGAFFMIIEDPITPEALLPWLALPSAWWLIIQLFRTPPSPVCNVLLARTAQLQLLFGGLLTIRYLL